MEELYAEGRQATTSVGELELFHGAYTSLESKHNLERTSALLGRIGVLPLDLSASDKAAEILAVLAEEGNAIYFRDALIAWVSVVNDLPVLTSNRDHCSRIKGRLETW